MVLGQNVEQDEMTCRVQEWQVFLLLAFSPFVIFDTEKPLVSCPLCKSKNFWNIFVILGRNVEQVQKTCRLQEWQLVQIQKFSKTKAAFLTFGINSLCYISQWLSKDFVSIL